jgi:hypothetical protein
MWVARVLGRLDEYRHVAMNAASVLKKLGTDLFLFLVGITPAIGCLILRIQPLRIKAGPRILND